MFENNTKYFGNNKEFSLTERQIQNLEMNYGRLKEKTNKAFEEIIDNIAIEIENGELSIRDGDDFFGALSSKLKQLYKEYILDESKSEEEINVAEKLQENIEKEEDQMKEEVKKLNINKKDASNEDSHIANIPADIGNIIKTLKGINLKRLSICSENTLNENGEGRCSENCPLYSNRGCIFESENLFTQDKAIKILTILYLREQETTDLKEIENAVGQLSEVEKKILMTI